MEVEVEMKVDVVMEVSLVVQVLQEALSPEAISMRGVLKKVKSLKHELNVTQGIIELVANWKLHSQLSVHAIILEMREVVCEAEDVLERFLVNEGSSRRRGLFYFKSIIMKYCAETEIDSIRARLSRISDRMASYGHYNRCITQVRDTDDLRSRREYPHYDFLNKMGGQER